VLCAAGASPGFCGGRLGLRMIWGIVVALPPESVPADAAVDERLRREPAMEMRVRRGR
jgi:hypothetical protein